MQDNGPGSSGVTWVENPPFNANLYNSMTWLPEGSNFLRGCIETYPGTTERRNNKQRYRLNFLYNPTTISVSHSIDTTVQPGSTGDDTKKALMNNQVLGTVAGNLSFSLLFDRTYELWGERGKTGPGTYGVYQDVRALYRMLNMTPDREQAGPELMVDYMHAQLVTVYFGGILSPGSLAYYGVITGVDLDYTHWDYQMVPTRCVVNVGVQLFPVPTTSSGQTEYYWQDRNRSTSTPSPSTGTNKGSAPKGSSASTVGKGDGSLIRGGKPATTPGPILGGVLGFRSN